MRAGHSSIIKPCWNKIICQISKSQPVASFMCLATESLIINYYWCHQILHFFSSVLRVSRHIRGSCLSKVDLGRWRASSKQSCANNKLV